LGLQIPDLSRCPQSNGRGFFIDHLHDFRIRQELFDERTSAPAGHGPDVGRFLAGRPHSGAQYAAVGGIGAALLLAATLLLPWLYFSGGLGALRHWSVKTWLGMFAAGATGVFGYASFFLTGLQHLPAGKAALLITLNPVVTLAFAVWLFKERINATIALGMLLAACGAVVVISHGDPMQLLNGTVGVGEMLILGCVACWVCYTLIGRAMLAGVDALAATTVTSIFGALLLLPASLVLEGPQGLVSAFQASGTAWTAMGLHGLWLHGPGLCWYSRASNRWARVPPRAISRWCR
jgi:drug/metabolite transporter (DMT)-like permease